MLLGASLGLSPKLLADILNTSVRHRPRPLLLTSRRRESAGHQRPTTPHQALRPRLPRRQIAVTREGMSPRPLIDTDWSRFLSKLMAKDLNLAISASQAASTPLPIGSLTSTLYNTLSKHDEFADKDFSVVYEYLRIAREGGLKKE